MLKKLLIGFILLCGLLVFGFYYFVFGFYRGSADFGRDFKNAVWLQHAWVEDETYLLQVPELVSALSENKISYVFVHVGPLEEDGRIAPERYRLAADFLTRARGLNREIEYLAWIGQLRSKISLDSELTRENVLKTSVELTDAMGFDGIHIDIEPIKDSDTDFIALLEFLSERFTAKVSVALGKFVPETVVRFVDLKQYNTAAFYARVDELVDQIAVMTYETKAESAQLYSWFVEQQVVYLSGIVDRAELLIGIPTYSYEGEDLDKFPDFHPEAENITSGLAGVVNGLKNIRTKTANVGGVALYAYWETAEDEWRVWREDWVERE